MYQDCSLGASPFLPPLLPFPCHFSYFAFPRLWKSVAGPGVKESLAAEKVIDGGGDEEKSRRPDVVTFPRAEWAVPPPLEAEVEESGKTSNPVVLWQVYALGGFLVVRWVWARWKERRGGQKKADDGDEEEEGAEDGI